MEYVDLTSNLDWGPIYLAKIFDEDFFDMSELWKYSSALTDSEMLNCIDGNFQREIYCPEVEDVSLDDEILWSAVEEIEEQ